MFIVADLFLDPLTRLFSGWQGFVFWGVKAFGHLTQSNDEVKDNETEPPLLHKPLG
jgi:hypothetical protein